MPGCTSYPLPPASLLLRFDTPQGSKTIRENAESLLEVRYEKSFYTGQSFNFYSAGPICMRGLSAGHGGLGVFEVDL